MKAKWLVVVGVVVVALVAYQYGGLESKDRPKVYQLPAGTSDIWVSLSAEVIGEKSGLDNYFTINEVKILDATLATSGAPSSAPTTWEKTKLTLIATITENGAQVAHVSFALPFDSTIKGGSDTSDYYGFDHTNIYSFKLVSGLSKGTYNVQIQIVDSTDGTVYSTTTMELT